MTRGNADYTSGRMRLLFVADSLHTGGAERHAVSLASALAQQGHAVTIACSAGGSLTSLAEQGGITVCPLMHTLVKRRVSGTFAWRLAKLVRKEHFDLVHAHMYASAAASAWATVGTGIPLVLTEHSEAAWRSFFARSCARWYYTQARRVIAVSRTIERRLIECDGVSANHITVISNALPPQAIDHTCTHSELPTEVQAGPLVGVVARLEAEKGIAHFLEAAARIQTHLPDVHFLVIGDGPLRHTLQMYARQLGVQEHVHFLGFRQDGGMLLQLLDILVIPSLSEGTPLVTLEAMAVAVPIVASAVGGIPEQIRHDSEGLLVPPGDSQALSDAILRLLQSPTQARRLGEMGRRRVASEFNFSDMVERTKNVYWLALGWKTGGIANSRDLHNPVAETRR